MAFAYPDRGYASRSCRSGRELELFPHKRPTLAAAQVWNPDSNRAFIWNITPFSPEELAYVTVSPDGGHTFSEAKLITSDTNALIASGCNTVPGGIGIDEANGIVYALWLSGNDVVSSAVTGCNYSQIGPFNKAWVSRSTDGGNTWTATLAWQGAFDVVTKIGDNASKIFATLSSRSGRSKSMLCYQSGIMIIHSALRRIVRPIQTVRKVQTILTFFSSLLPIRARTGLCRLISKAVPAPTSSLGPQLVRKASSTSFTTNRPRASLTSQRASGL